MIRIFIAIFGLCVILNANVSVSVSIIPQAFFVKKIAGDLADVNIMVQKGKSPETYEPSIKQLKNLSQSAVYFRIGMPFEDAWMERFKSVNPNMKIIQPLKNNDLEKYLEQFEDEDHHNDAGHSHDEDSHEGHNHAPHIWLSFILSKLHATQIAESLIDLDSKNAKIYKKNLDSFLSEIDRAYEDSKQLFKDNKKAFLVFHPAWGYVANELGLKEYAIEKDGKETKISHTKEILEIIKQNNIKIIFTQPQFSQKNAKAIAKEANIEVRVADPLSYDWLNSLIDFLKIIAEN